MDEIAQLPDSRILVPCGRCSACRRAKALTWRGRLLREYDDFCSSGGYSDQSPSSLPPVYFVTLTINDAWRPLVEEDPSSIMRWFFEDLRAICGKSPRHWFIVEYGDYKKYTGRIHFHGLLFGLNGLLFSDIRRAWRFGSRVDITRVRSRACMTYVTKYITKGNQHSIVQAQTGRFPFLSKIYASSGIGASLYTSNEESIVKAARSLGPITVSWKNFDYAVPYYYIAKACNRVSEHIMAQRRILNAFLRQTTGWLRYFGYQVRDTFSSVNFANALNYLPPHLHRYARLALLEAFPSPPSEMFAVRSVSHLLSLFSDYEFDYLCAPGAVSQVECSLRKIRARYN